ncbi:MAG: FAD-dependent oxidoreductase [Pseudonocardiaceae bacterium]
MSSIIVCGGGIVGLSAAMMLAADGHAVTVLEADLDPVPASPAQAWQSWRRKGVAQFHQPHGLQARFRHVCEQELPGLTRRLLAAGCVWENFRHPLPPTVSDRSPRPDDDATRTITGRRPIVEAVVAAAAEDQPRVMVRRGVRVSGLLPGPAALPGVPHVAGVTTSSGEQLAADLVIDTMGRRSPSPAWLATLGARPPRVDADDHRFVYYTRYFTGPTPPPRRAPVLTPMGSFSVLTLACDNHTWSVTLVATTTDPVLKTLRHPECFTRVVAACPRHAHWLDGQPITGVLAIAGISDRHRRFVLDGQPIVTGFAPVGDAWACTNPTGGRGLSLGLMHAQQLRHVARDHLDDPAEFARALDEHTTEFVAPYYWNKVAEDRARLAEMTAHRHGLVPNPPDTPIAPLLPAAAYDPDAFRGFIDTVSCLALPEEVLARPAVKTAVHREQRPAPTVPGPDRTQLLALLAETTAAAR